MEGQLATILKEKYTGKPALLIGNGINRMSQNNMSWKAMLDYLIKRSGTKSEIGEKPLTFLFEEIIHRMDKGATKENIRDLKIWVRESIEKNIEPNKLHEQITELQIENILTTNYDYCFEKVLDKNFTKPKSDKKEKFDSSKYSLGRYNTVKNKKIWHINGELDNGYIASKKKPNKYPEHSIMLGFDQYASYLKRIFDVIEYADKKNKDKEGYNEKSLEEIISKQELWISFFFTHDIHIVGLEMNMVETHLWWLLNLRANLYDRKECILNNIIYYIPAIPLQTKHVPGFQLQEKKDQIDLLKSLHVSVKEIDFEFSGGNIFMEHYQKVLDLLKEI